MRVAPRVASWGRSALGRAASVVRFARDHYADVDPRTAGLFRIALGVLTTFDALRHWHESDWAYSNAGVVTNHYHLFRPDSGYNFSLLHAFSSPAEVDVAFALAVFCHLCLLFGFHTRLFAVATFVIVTSIDNRLVMVENGGYVVVNLIAGYAMFLPLERRFSIDALLRSYRERKERGIADLAVRYRPAWATEPYVSIAGLLVVLNLAAIYFFNVVNKSGNIWRTGETVHYVLWLNRMVTGLAVVARRLLPFWSTRLLSWAVLCVEALLVAWILSPYARRKTRPLALLFLAGLHTSFGLMMRLGPFSWYLVGWGTLLIPSEVWGDLEAWYRRGARAQVVVLDRASPLAFHVGRLLARLDRLDLLTFEASSEAPGAADLVRVVDPVTGASLTGIAGAREIAQALPGGRFLFPVARVLSLGALDLCVRLAPRHRDGIAGFFALAGQARGRERQVDGASPLATKVQRARAVVRESLLAWLGICSVLQAMADNKSVPPWMKPKDLPSIVHATLGYPRMFQGWGMFAPNPITDDGSLTVDAITVTGRHVDPFTGEAPDLDLTDAEGLGLSQIRQDYFNRVRLEKNKHYRQGLKDWLLAYPQRTGRPEDEIVAFDVYWVRALCPKPHQKKPYDNKLLALLTYRKSGYKPPPPLPPLPKEPPIENAELDSKANNADPKAKAAATTK